MIWQVAYRNIWRNKLRSLVVVSAIALGIWGSLLVLGLAQGLLEMRHNNAVSTYVSHIQIHAPDYLQLGSNDLLIDDLDDLRKFLNKQKEILAYSVRLKTECFVQSSKGNSALILNGIDPKEESSVTDIHQVLEQGNYLSDYKSKPPILISVKFADRLGLEIGATILLSFSDMNGKTVSAVFRIVDFYTSGNSVYDEANAFVPRSILGDLMHTESAHEVALILRDEEKVDQFLSEIQKEFPSLDMRSWRALAPELGYADQMMGLIMTLFLGIIMAALAFGIVNTMLMAVLERRKELGMLLAIGMNKRKVFRMIMLETSLLTFLGAPVGMVLSVLSQLILSRTGIDLSFLSEGLRSVGLESVIYPSLDIQPLIIMSILVVITGILSALYPARKAIRLNPGETLRTAA